MAEHVSHRAGPMKKPNKAHKTGRHRSKGQINTESKGRVSLKAASHANKQQQRREQRRNQINQLRKNKREEVIANKRKLGTQIAAPFLVCILPLNGDIDSKSALSILENCDPDAVVDRSLSGVTYIYLPRFKQRIAFVIPPTGRGNELTVLDYLKVCDTTLLLTSAVVGEDEVLDKWGHRIFNMISAQGIPTPIVGLMDLQSINPKHRKYHKTLVQKIISKLLPNEKVMPLETNDQGLNVLRRIGGQKKNTLHNRENRPHLFGDSVEFIPDANAVGGEDTGTVKVTGFLRGHPLDVNGLVHISGLGDFQLSQIDVSQHVNKNDKTTINMPMMQMCIKSDPKCQTSLQRENIPDDMDAEQTWPTEEEIREAEKEAKKTRLVKRVPKGWSEYQAAWIPEVEAVEVEEDPSDSENGDDNDHDEFMSCDNESLNSDKCNENVDSDGEEYFESTTQSEAAINDANYDQEIDLYEERETMKKIKEARVDEMWPDEIDTPIDVPARDRFQKYRGLESFKNSPWDPKENLPRDYARIYQFQNFDRTKRRILSEAKESIKGAMPGWYITLHVANVSDSKWKAFKSAQQTNNIVVYGLLPYEHQMSVMTVVLKRMPDSEAPIKSKEKLIVQCGYRRFVVNPIFSQHTNGDKHKFERYFRPHTMLCATFYAPIQFPPAPVLAFKENPDTTLALIARGCVLYCNPNRIILKRIVLSGHPMRINRKSATIRYMFFNKEDVEYFQPIQLRTKCGRVGHIKESLGTHGHMKCLFDGQLRSYDTVFMYLYKRVYPKWTYADCLIQCPEENEKQQEMSIE